MTVRVLHVITGLNTGGAERMLEKIVTSSERRCTDIVVSLLDHGPIGRRLVDRGIEVHALGFARGGVSAGGLWKLIGILRRTKPQVVQGWMYHGNLAASMAVALSLLRGVSVHWGIRQTLYGLDTEKRATRATIWLLARLSKRPASIHYNSRKSREQHEDVGFAASRGIVIPNGFDVDVYRREAGQIGAAKAALGIAVDSLVIGMITRDHPMKDQQTFLEAAARFLKAGGDARFVLAGRGINRENSGLWNAIEALGLQSRTHLLGELAEPAEAYRAMDVLALSSAWGDAFPNVLGEAMCFGIPCVTTDVGDSAFIVGDSGRVVAVRDPDAMARAFLELQQMGDDGRRRLGALARDRVERNFSMREVSRKFNDLHGIR